MLVMCGLGSRAELRRCGLELKAGLRCGLGGLKQN